MNTNSSTTASGGIGFTGLLTILFIALKLTHVITWSWWWVLSPIWISAALTIAIVAVVLGIAFLVVSVKERKGARR
ncbi:MAG: hypothetical protein HOY79_17550 [Streptomyces sp.]|nr:hypothetical protein [Streptomyces sp.]